MFSLFILVLFYSSSKDVLNITKKEVVHSDFLFESEWGDFIEVKLTQFYFFQIILKPLYHFTFKVYNPRYINTPLDYVWLSPTSPTDGRV